VAQDRAGASLKASICLF